MKKQLFLRIAYRIFFAIIMALFVLFMVVLTTVVVQAQTSVPIISTDSAKAIVAGELVLYGNIDPKGSPTTAWFEWKYKGESNFTGTNNVVNQTLNVGVVSKTITGLLPDTIIKFRLIAINAIGQTTGSILSFSTNPDTSGGSPDIMVQIATADATNVAEAYATLNVIYISTVPLRLWFEIDTVPNILNFIPTSLVFKNAGSGTASFNMIGLLPGKTYYYRAIALPDGGTQVFAFNVVSFTTLGTATGIDDEAGDEVEVSIFPNPVIDRAQIRFGDKNGVLTLFDVTGRKVKTVDVVDGEGVFDRENLSQGFYIYKLISEDGILKTGKMVVAK